MEVASGYRLQIKNEYSRLLLPMWQDNSSKTSKALMETLTIIAYKQPITRGEIESIRGVSVSTQIIRNLTERKWIKVSGYKDVHGRPALYKTTKGFLDDFQFKSIEDLPEITDSKRITDLELNFG